MGNTATVEIWAPAEDVVRTLTDQATTPLTTNRVESTVIQLATGIWAIGYDEADGSTLLVADSIVDSNALARRAYDLLAARTAWRLELTDADTADVVAERPALATA